MPGEKRPAAVGHPEEILEDTVVLHPPKYSALEKSTRRPSIISMKPTSFTSEFAILHQTVLLCEPEWR